MRREETIVMLSLSKHDNNIDLTLRQAQCDILSVL
jgi:hypothetical protein